jgi:hypothetical protein
MWQKEINEIAHKENIEVFESDNKIFFYCPKINNDIKETLIRKLPMNTPYEFIEGPKPITSLSIKAILAMSGIINAHINQSSRRLKIETLSGISLDESLFDELNRIIEKDGYFDSWTFIQGDNSRTVYFNLSKGKPVRKTSIHKDEVTNLIIALNTTSVDEFLNLI